MTLVTQYGDIILCSLCEPNTYQLRNVNTWRSQSERYGVMNSPTLAHWQEGLSSRKARANTQPMVGKHSHNTAIYSTCHHPPHLPLRLPYTPLSHLLLVSLLPYKVLISSLHLLLQLCIPASRLLVPGTAHQLLNIQINTAIITYTLPHTLHFHDTV